MILIIVFLCINLKASDRYENYFYDLNLPSMHNPDEHFRELVIKQPLMIQASFSLRVVERN